MPELIRGLKFLDAWAIVVGSMIGTGVFLKTATMSQVVGSPVLVLAAWIIAGLLSLAGSFSYAEVGSRFPHAGGEYIYIQRAYGNLPAFLFGWTRFWIASPASHAAYAVGAATFLAALIPLEPYGGKTVTALAFLLFFNFLNCFTVAFGGRVQALMTVIKFLLLSSIIIGVFFLSPTKDFGNFTHSGTAVFSFSAFGTAMLAALWAYDGWNNLPMVAGEIKNPGRNLPLSLTLGTLAVLVVYLLINFSYFLALPFSEIVTANSKLHTGALPVASKTVLTFLGPWGATLIASLFVFSALGAMNGSILTGARVPYAMARDGMFFKILAKVHPKTHVPVVAILVQSVAGVIFTLSGTFDQLTDWVVFSSWIFYALVTYSVFLLRRRGDVAEATYKVPGYPVVPAIFCIGAVLLLINTIYTSPKETLCGIVFIALGVPAYYLFRPGVPLVKEQTAV